MPSTADCASARDSVSWAVKIMALMRIALPSRPARSASARRKSTFFRKVSSLSLMALAIAM